MTVTYKFNNLQSLADHFENKAAHKRDEGKRYGSAKTLGHRECLSEARAFEEVAHVLRNTVLEEIKPR